MSKQTYIFFEPWNEEFFSVVAEAYSREFINNLIDIAGTLEAYYDSGYPPDEKVKQTVENYYKNLPFPACNFIIKLNCTSNLCGIERKAVISSRQEKQLIEVIDRVTEELEKKNIVRTSLISKIKSMCPWYDKSEIIFINKRHGHKRHLHHYIIGINGRNRPEKDAEAFVYVCAPSNSDYADINAKTKLKPLKTCNEFHKFM